MRTDLLLAALAFTVVGCTYYVQPEPNDPNATARRDEQCTSAYAGAGSNEDDSSAAADAPPPSSLPKEEGTFEFVARHVLRAIPYKDCGTGGRGDVDVTFMPNGAVQKVVVYADGWDDSAKQCVAERFALAHVVPFGGHARTVRWHTTLDDGGWGT